MQQTNWDDYYDNTFWAAKYSRAYSTKILLDTIRNFTRSHPNPSILEFGGGNSCFFHALWNELNPSKYTVVDTNSKSLEMFRQRYASFENTYAIKGDVLDGQCMDNLADIVFSVGLIEHFETVDTLTAIRTHFDCVRPGGLVIITFPTPTWLYRITRNIAESMGRWGFPDETPLPTSFVEDAMNKQGTVFSKQILWPIVLTQGIIAAHADKSKRDEHDG